MDAAKKEPVSFESLTDREAAAIAADPEVEAVAPAMRTKLIQPLEAAGADLSDVWGLDETGARGSKFTGVGVTVAVLDTGIDAAHPAFAGIQLEQRDFTGEGYGDKVGHGTHCAGTIFGRNVGGLRIGVAPGVQRALIGKVLGADGGDSQMLVEGIQWAVNNGVNIVSMSLGFDFTGMVADWTADGWPVALATSNALETYRVNLRVLDAVLNLTKAQGAFGSGGTLVVAASGNESQRQQDPDWKIAASLPAAAEHVISVGALNRNGAILKVADFSNTRPTVSAPGVDIVSARAGGGLEAMSGTSMACPHVAGLAALWWEALRAKRLKPTAMNVQAHLLTSATRAPFAADSLEEDIGQGLVLAP
ncbi:S8 family peptidase [Komagataeibacter oboediens]|uniref:S8 family peptidase n=1 Tax=Komagataeibacter oboediens TaxID=65958 RepID=UPI0020C2D14A|nr:S8 family serine peptidase [Komagataeibacter oboediens]